MKRAVVFAASLASLLSLGSLEEGTQATKETKGTEPGGARPVATSIPARRARPPLMRRREGAIPCIVTIPYGKTASGERTHIYRIMGQGGVVADFTDYGARLVRLYAPDETGDLANVIEGFRPSVIDCEKAGDLAEVWKMTPIRRPRATGLAFEREVKGTQGTEETKGTNGVASVSSVALVPSSRVVYWLDAANTLTIESTISDTNAVKWASSLRLAPLAKRSLAVKTPDASLSLATTTNITEISLRPLTNATQRAEFNFKGIKKL